MSTITGIPQLDAKLKHLELRVGRKACRSALAKGMTVIARSMRSNVPQAKTPGHSNVGLKRAIKGRQVREKTTGIVSAKVGVNVGSRSGKQSNRRIGTGERVYHLMALGTVDRWTGSKRSGSYRMGRTSTGNKRMFRGRMKGDQFVTKGFRASEAAALAIMVQAVADVVKKEASK